MLQAHNEYRNKLTNGVAINCDQTALEKPAKPIPQLVLFLKFFR